VTVGIYRIALDDGRCYVGQSVNIEQRWYEHQSDLRRGVHHSPYLQRCWNKFGAEAFTHEVLEVCEVDPSDRELVKSTLAEREQWWMDNTESVFNVTPAAGSSLGYRHTEETRAKMRVIKQSMRPWTTEERAAISARMKGVPNSPEHCANMSKALKGRVITPEWRANISAATKGRPHSPEHVAKRVASRMTNMVAKWLETERPLMDRAEFRRLLRSVGWRGSKSRRGLSFDEAMGVIVNRAMMAGLREAK